MRILCLHDENSCATTVISQLKELGERLHQKHQIELAFANSPLLSEPETTTDDGSPGHKPQEVEELEQQQRTWFLQPNKVGLDASILHLKQLWSRSLYSQPFSGILGIGQGGALASLLPLLRYELEGPEKEDDDGEVRDSMPLFEGLEFCILIQAWDMTESSFHQETNGTNIDMTLNTVPAVDIPSLHIFSKDSERSRHLYHLFGGQKRNEEEADKDDNRKSLQSMTRCWEVESSNGVPLNAKIYNVLGRFIVEQKKRLLSKQVTCLKLMDDEGATFQIRNDAEMNHTSDKEKQLLSMIESTRQELAVLEQKSIQMINATIAVDPPKALVAVISPDDARGGVMVGGWSGDRDAFRSQEFKESGGAPCPKDFVLPDSKRLHNKK